MIDYDDMDDDEDMEDSDEGEEKYSDKKQLVALLLSAFLGPFGAGKKKIDLLNIFGNDPL